MDEATPIYTRKDVGTHAELEHVREVLADMVRPHHSALANILLLAASNSLIEEREALAILNEHTEPGLTWTTKMGDLRLVSAGKPTHD